MELRLKKSSEDFQYFVENVFAASFPNFILGEHIARSCNILTGSKRTIRVSARVHFKSLSLYAHVMWNIVKMRYHKNSMENHYFSYKAEMASYHVGSRANTDNIRNLVKRNPYFTRIIDNKPTAEAVLDFSWKPGINYTLYPHGMMTFKRGLHCNGALYVDDALQDPAEKLDPKIVYRINSIFYTQLIDIPLGEESETHVVGTAQTEEDFYFDVRSKELFDVHIMPGVTNIKADKQGWIKEGKALWPEWMNLEAHQIKQRSQGVKVYSQEYLCNPLYSSDAFFQKWQIEAIAKRPNMLKRESKADEDVIGGWDLGKHAHPAHFSIIVFNQGKAIQVHEKWFDKVNYTDQLEYIEKAVEDFGIDTVYYDNTRGELEALEERGELGPEFEPMHFSLKLKHTLATELERYVTSGNLSLINNRRSINQICLVTNDLKARETKEGHGDSFWSNALCFAGALQSEPTLYIHN